MLSSQTGKLYGSVGHDIISKTVKEVNNVELEDRYIKLTESIKEHGVYNVRVEISDELNTMIKVLVHDPEQTPEELLLHPETDYVAEFTKDVDRAKVLTVSAVMSAADIPSTKNITVSEKSTVGQVASQVLRSNQAVDVQNNAGELIGTLTPEAVLKVLVDDLDGEQ